MLVAARFLSIKGKPLTEIRLFEEAAKQLKSYPAWFAAAVRSTVNLSKQYREGAQDRSRFAALFRDRTTDLFLFPATEARPDGVFLLVPPAGSNLPCFPVVMGCKFYSASLRGPTTLNNLNTTDLNNVYLKADLSPYPNGEYLTYRKDILAAVSEFWKGVGQDAGTIRLLVTLPSSVPVDALIEVDSDPDLKLPKRQDAVLCVDETNLDLFFDKTTCATLREFLAQK